MRVERAGATESADELKRNYSTHRGRGARESFAVGPPRQLRVAERPERNRVQRLLDLTELLLQETRSLARDEAFTDESNRLQALTISEGIDFYNEVQRFETTLIRLALDQTGGHQAKAANLLHIKPTTLNSKIKLYGIEY